VVTLVHEPARHVEAHPAHAPDADVHTTPFGRRQVSGFSYLLIPDT
jgi:hypothetical protein